jgi:uncharacterized protein (TIRG00374 family)
LSTGAVLSFRREPRRLRREWTGVILLGFSLLALLSIYASYSVTGSLAVWAYCAMVSYRRLSENHREDDGERTPLSSLGVPTLVTLARGFLVALAAGFLFVPRVVAPLYSLAAVLDHFDGRIARRQRRATRLGSRLDMEVDALGIFVACLAGIVLGKLPLWYVAVGLARYLYLGGRLWRERSGLPLRDLDPHPLRRLLAGWQMGFVAVSLWPQIPAGLSLPAAYLFGGATLAMFARDWLYVTGATSMRMDSRRLVRIGLWLGAGVLLWATLHEVYFPESLRLLAGIRPEALALLVAVNLFALVVFTLRWWIVLDGLGARIPLPAACAYRLAAFGLSYLTPGPQVGGEPLQVLLLERRRGVSREVAVASVALDRLIEVMISFGYLLTAFVFLAVPTGSFPLVLLLALLVPPALYLATLASGRTPLADLFDRIFVRFARAQELLGASEATAGAFCRGKPLHLGFALAASILSFALMLGEYWLLARALGMPLSFRGVVLGLTAARVAYLLFLPAALGVLEAGQIAAVSALGFAPELAIGLVLFVRARDVLLAATGLSWGVKAVTAAK